MKKLSSQLSGLHSILAYLIEELISILSSWRRYTISV